MGEGGCTQKHLCQSTLGTQRRHILEGVTHKGPWGMGISKCLQEHDQPELAGHGKGGAVTRNVSY